MHMMTTNTLLHPLRLTLMALGLSASVPLLAQSPGGSGPYTAAMMAEDSLPSHTLYRPLQLDTVDSLPIVLWGNGGCADSSLGYEPFLREVASHGFLVIAVGAYRETPPPREERDGQQDEGPPPVWPPLASHASDLIDGLEWALDENEREGSVYQGRLATERVATIGHSCGGVQAIEAGQDPRVATVLPLNSGLMAADDPFMQRFAVDRSVFEHWEKPIAYFIGGEEDVAYPNAEDDWPLLKSPSVLANLPVGHGATFSETNGGAFAIGPLSWLKWQLRDDRDAAQMFIGAGCGLCRLPDWHVKTRALQD